MARLLVQGEAAAVDFAPNDLAAEVSQNVRMIMATPKGSVPLDRDFGLDFSLLDQPLPRARALLAAEIVRQVARYEPRARVARVDWAESELEAMDGGLRPIVVIDVLEDR